MNIVKYINTYSVRHDIVITSEFRLFQNSIHHVCYSNAFNLFEINVTYIKGSRINANVINFAYVRNICKLVTFIVKIDKNGPGI